MKKWHCSNSYNPGVNTSQLLLDSLVYSLIMTWEANALFIAKQPVFVCAYAQSQREKGFKPFPSHCFSSSDLKLCLCSTMALICKLLAFHAYCMCTVFSVHVRHFLYLGACTVCVFSECLLFQTMWMEKRMDKWARSLMFKLPGQSFGSCLNSILIWHRGSWWWRPRTVTKSIA